MSEDSVRTEGSSPARAGEAARQLVRRTRQVTRRKFPAEEKIRIVLEGIRGEVAVSELCRREGIHPIVLENVAVQELIRRGWMLCTYVSRGKNKGVRLTPHPFVRDHGRFHLAGAKEGPYVAVSTETEIVAHLKRGLSLRMSNRAAGYPPSLISPKSVSGWE